MNKVAEVLRWTIQDQVPINQNAITRYLIRLSGYSFAKMEMDRIFKKLQSDPYNNELLIKMMLNYISLNGWNYEGFKILIFSLYDTGNINENYLTFCAIEVIFRSKQIVNYLTTYPGKFSYDES